MNAKKNRSLLLSVLLCFGLCAARALDESKPKIYSVRGELLPDGSRKVINFDTWGSIEMYSTATVVSKSANSVAFSVVTSNTYPQTNPHYQVIVTTQGCVGIATAAPAALFTVGNGTMVVTSGGNVGIGTASPGAKLEVNGNLKLATPLAAAYGGTGGTTYPPTSGFWTHSGATVYSGSAVNSYTDLNLSSYVGANRALVLLKVYVTNSDGSWCNFRTNGETYAIALNAYAHGISGLYPENGTMAYAMVETDSSGIIEWITDSTSDLYTITLMGYIK